LIRGSPRRVLLYTQDGEGSRPWAVSRTSGERSAQLVSFS
jgi:hypothetical protein